MLLQWCRPGEGKLLLPPIPPVPRFRAPDCAIVPTDRTHDRPVRRFCRPPVVASAAIVDSVALCCFCCFRSHHIIPQTRKREPVSLQGLLFHIGDRRHSTKRVRERRIGLPGVVDALWANPISRAIRPRVTPRIGLRPVTAFFTLKNSKISSRRYAGEAHRRWICGCPGSWPHPQVPKVSYLGGSPI